MTSFYNFTSTSTTTWDEVHQLHSDNNGKVACLERIQDSRIASALACLWSLSLEQPERKNWEILAITAHFELIR